MPHLITYTINRLLNEVAREKGIKAKDLESYLGRFSSRDYMPLLRPYIQYRGFAKPYHVVNVKKAKRVMLEYAVSLTNHQPIVEKKRALPIQRPQEPQETPTAPSENTDYRSNMLRTDEELKASITKTFLLWRNLFGDHVEGLKTKKGRLKKPKKFIPKNIKYVADKDFFDPREDADSEQPEIT